MRPCRAPRCHPSAARAPRQPALTACSITLILHHMVKHETRLSRTFAALADPTRRAILARLERESAASVSKLAQPFAIGLPAVMKHLDVLAAAGLIHRSKAGRTVTVRLAPAPMQAALDWLHRYERFWSERLERLALHAEREEAQTRRNSRRPA